MSEKMRAIVVTGPDEYGVQLIDKPVPGPGEVLCRIRSVAICGSDVGLFNGHYQKSGWPPKYPFVFGHEWSGEVVELGPGAECFKVGDRVAGEGHCGCGLCENCRKGQYTLCLNYGRLGHHHYGFNTYGAYAEYAVYREKSLTPMPEGISYDEATLCDTAGVALHGNNIVGVGSGDTVVVYGPGPVGNCAMQFAHIKGARTIVVGFHDHERLETAKRCGADVIMDSADCDAVAEVLRLTDGMGTTVAMDCAGSESAISSACCSVRKGGRVALIAMPCRHEMLLPVRDIVMNEIAVVGTRANPNCSAEVMVQIAFGRLNASALLTHRFKLNQFHEAMDTFINKRDGALKVVIHPQE